MYRLVEELITYGKQKNLIVDFDVPLVRNMMYNRLGLLDNPPVFEDEPRDVYVILEEIADKLGLSFVYERDGLFAELTSYMLPLNSVNSERFWALLGKSPKEATKKFYEDSINSTYIRMDRVSKNWVWKYDSSYGTIDITINMTKPEKTPEEIMLVKSAPTVNYPKCMLCTENVGFRGTSALPPRHNLRTVSMTLAGEPWQFQFSPYVYYDQHAICFSTEHRPMKIDRACFKRLFDFVDILPHYFIGSNADLHTVGGSILTHDHYQAGSYEMPMFKSRILKDYGIFDEVRLEMLDWPLSVVKLSSANKDKILNLSDKIFNAWVGYSDVKMGILAHTTERHNTVTPIARKVDGEYIMYLALRNNRASDEHPTGIFHPHEVHHHIKRENIGLIEVMGLAVLPSRLTEELQNIVSFVHGASAHPEIQKHMSWLEEVRPKIEGLGKEQALEVLKQEVGLKFTLAIENSGVFKGDISAHDRFVESIGL